MLLNLSPFALLPDFGGGEMMVILLVVLLLFGGDKMPQLAKSLGKSIREFRRAANEVEREIKRAIEIAEHIQFQYVIQHFGAGGADFSAVVQSVGSQAFPGVDFSGRSPHHLVVVVPHGCGGGTSGRARLGTSFADGGSVIIDARPQAQLLAAHARGVDDAALEQDRAAARRAGIL